MRTPRTLVALAIGLATVPAASALADGTVVEKPLGSTSSPWGYLEYLPPGYDSSPNEHYPIVVALAGIGEIGNGTTQLELVADNGPIKMIKDGATYFADKKVIVIAPQAPDQWEFDPQLTSMKAFLPYLESTYHVDTGRIYMTGLSAGGGGVYTFIGSGFAEGIVAGAIAICGNQDPYDSFIPPFAKMPLWSFQNWGDPTNTRTRPIGWTTKIGDERSGNATLDVMNGYPNTNGDPTLAAAGTETAIFDGTSFTWNAGVPTDGSSTLRLTLYTAAQHDAWTATYADTGVWDWLLSQGTPMMSSSSSSTSSSAASTSASGTSAASTGAGPSSTSGSASTGSGSTAGSGGAGGAGNTSSASGDAFGSAKQPTNGGCSIGGDVTPTSLGAPLALAAFAGFVRRSRRRGAPKSTTNAR